jgi:hypothetical protein
MVSSGLQVVIWAIMILITALVKHEVIYWNPDIKVGYLEVARQLARSNAIGIVGTRLIEAVGYNSSLFSDDWIQSDDR